MHIPTMGHVVASAYCIHWISLCDDVVYHMTGNYYMIVECDHGEHYAIIPKCIYDASLYPHIHRSRN